MLRRSSRGKDPVIDTPSSPVLKRTWHSSEVPNSERFKTPLDSQTFSSIFQDAPPMVERIVHFDTLGSPLSRGFLQSGIGLSYLETSKIQLMNWLRSFIRMQDTQV